MQLLSSSHIHRSSQPLAQPRHDLILHDADLLQAVAAADRYRAIAFDRIRLDIDAAAGAPAAGPALDVSVTAVGRRAPLEVIGVGVERDPPRRRRPRR